MQTQWIPTCSKVESVFRSLADSFYPSPRADEFLSPRGRLDSWRPSQRRGSHCRLRNSSERKRFVVIFVRKRGTKALAKRSYKSCETCVLSRSQCLTSGQVTQPFWPWGFSSTQWQGSLPERWQNANSRHHCLWIHQNEPSPKQRKKCQHNLSRHIQKLLIHSFILNPFPKYLQSASEGPALS